ncbi:TBC1 domain family member 15-like [Actinia tenebrosa]|uniref:TBC1 domain family member 15-like n=1 Tax=Actinia tenebrosa TaxID=6105 RepID=A0A6P8IG79_ACTTE|nr:TBC1 domain family member 15-like [Actinia tenebrosa]
MLVMSQSHHLSLEYEVVNQDCAEGFCHVEMKEIESPVQVSERTHPLQGDEWDKMMDQDGRIINETALRKSIFKGSISSNIRAEVWRFLFGFYPFLSTTRERKVLLAENYSKYKAYKQRWKEMIKTQHNDASNNTLPAYVRECQQNLDTDDNNRNTDCSSSAPYLNDLDEHQREFLDITAKVDASRQHIDLDSLSHSIKTIDKDVPRTDRGHPYYSGNGNQNLLVLRDILITYAAYHKDVGYAQGMNDILSRFLVVLKSEAEAYFCFVNYMDAVKDDFLESGMMKKIELVQKLLKFMDGQLEQHFFSHNMSDLLFVHRWLILGFKREFAYEDSLKLFEIMSSQHLELHSMEAEREREKQRHKEREKDGGEFQTELVGLDKEYTFDLFICLAILRQYRGLFLNCTEVSFVYNTINSLSMKMDLNTILLKAEELFFQYCRKSVIDCFEVLDTTNHFQKGR